MKIQRPIIDFLFLIIFCLFGQYSYAQNSQKTSFEKIDLPGGHLGNSVQCMVQDSFGFMWLASKNGLHRWDGYQFKSYLNDPTNSNTIGGNYIEFIHLAKDGSLWLSVGWGSDKSLLDHFDPGSETFIHYDYQQDHEINHDAYLLTAITEDTEGNIWTGTHYGVYKLDIKTKRFKQYLNNPANPNSLSHNICRSIYKDSEGILWFGTGLFWDQSTTGGLNRYRPESDDFERYIHDPEDDNSLKSNVITELFEDSSGNFWIGTIKGGLHIMDKENGTFQRIAPPSFRSFKSSISQTNLVSKTFVQFIYEDQDNKLWISYYNGGLLNYDRFTETRMLYEADQNDPSSLPEKHPWSMYQSRDGTLWCSTTGAESVVFKIKQSNFVDFTLASSSNFVSALCETKDNKIWVGTFEEGLFQIDLKTNDRRAFTPKTIRSTFSNKNSDQTLNTNDLLKRISKIVEDDSGGIWILKDLYSGVIYFNPKQETAKLYSHDPNDDSSIGEGLVTDMVKDDLGQVWFVTSKGHLNLYVAAEDRFSKYRYTLLPYDGLGSGYNCQLLLTKTGLITNVSTGIKVGQLAPFISQFDPVKKEFKKVDFELTSNELASFDKEVYYLIEDRNSNIWLCNQTHLISIRPSDGHVKVYPSKQFESSYLKGMVLDNLGRIWIVGENISFFDPMANGFSIKKVFINTIKNFPGYKQTIMKTADGLIYIGGEGKFQSFAPDIIDENYGNILPPSIISDFRILDNKGGKEDTWNQKVLSNESIKLTYNQNTFSIRFATLSFQEPSQNKIQYRLDGFDEQWRTVGLDPISTYIKVPPGDYTFLVKGATLTSDWGKQQEIGIHISPPKWATWWAYTFYALAGLGFLYLLNKFQLNRKLEKAEALRLKELDVIKNRLFTNISHEFRTPLTVILGMADNLKTKIEGRFLDVDKSLEMIRRNGKGLLQLVNDMLDLAKIEEGKLELAMKQSDVIPFVKYVSESFHSLAHDEEVSLTIYSEVDHLLMDFDASKMSTIISNLLSNAIKFSSANGKIIVHLNQIKKGKSEYFFIKIKDNGVGLSEEEQINIFDRFYHNDPFSKNNSELYIPKVSQGTGIGLALTKELVELMKGTINVKSVLGKGSEFIIKIPVSRNASIGKKDLVPTKSDKVTSESGVKKDKHILNNDLELPIVLIIEDNKDVAHYLRTCLVGRYYIFHALNGKIGVEMAFEKTPDVIISDVMMPLMDGYEVCSLLKADERTSHIPIILLTAKATSEDKLTGLSMGADAYLSKPFEKEELMIRLSNLMEIRRILQVKFSDTLLNGQSNKCVLESKEDHFILKVEKIILAHLGEEDFTTHELARALHLSRSQVNRKIQALAGMSTAIYIRQIRLQKGKELLLSKVLSISEIAYQVGFKSPVYFSQAFKETFGESPSATRK